MSTTTSMREYGPILGVAILHKGVCYRLPAPNRHHHVILEIARINGKGIGGRDDQGFYSAKSSFMSREFALEVALACDQVLDPASIRSGQLFSEDLW